MAVGKSFLDQYSVFCVFGSVVGCVVVPLITQSVESLIFSAIVISLTANRFSKKVVLEPSIKGENKEQKSIKCSKDKEMNLNACKKKKKPPSNNINGTQSALYHQLSPSELRRQYKEEVERREYEKLREMERKDEEKREKKLKKKEERLKRKNNEKKVQESKQTIQKEKLNTSSDKNVRNGGVQSPKTEDKTPKQERTLNNTTPSPTYTNTTTSANSYYNMNSSRTKKYDYYNYRPNIPRFQRQAAKQRQMGYQQQQQQSWQTARSTPSPDDSFTGTFNENVSVPAYQDTSVIQPKVQSVIGCRKSPEPQVNGTVNTGIENIVKTEDMSGCYTLFGENAESKDLVSIIRQETGLQKS